MKMESGYSGSLLMTSIKLAIFSCGSNLRKMLDSLMISVLRSPVSFNFLLLDCVTPKVVKVSSKDDSEEVDKVDDGLLLRPTGPDFLNISE